MTDWTAARLAYVNSSKSLATIAKEYGATPAAVEKRAARERWSDERRKQSEKVGEQAQAVIADDRAATLAKFNEDDLRVAKAIRAKAASLLNSIASPSEMRSLASAFESAQRIGRLALGAETENAVVTSRELPASVDEFV